MAFAPAAATPAADVLAASTVALAFTIAACGAAANEASAACAGAGSSFLPQPTTAIDTANSGASNEWRADFIETTPGNIDLAAAAIAPSPSATAAAQGGGFAWVQSGKQY
jgi:hypothetical protein